MLRIEPVDATEKRNVERSGGYMFAWERRLKNCSIDYLKEELSYVYVRKEINLPRRCRRCRLTLVQLRLNRMPRVLRAERLKKIQLKPYN